MNKLNEEVTVIWEKPYIDSHNTLELCTGDKFGYEMILQGHSSKDRATGLETYYALCKVKIYPKLLRLGDTDYTFKSNPVLNYSYIDRFTVNWREANLKHDVLTKEELNLEEVLQKFLGMIRFGIEQEILPDIKKKFNLFLANR